MRIILNFDVRDSLISTYYKTEIPKNKKLIRIAIERWQLFYGEKKRFLEDL